MSCNVSWGKSVQFTTSKSGKTTMRASAVAATLAAGAACLLLASAAGSAAPPEPTYGEAKVDGSVDEWVLTGGDNDYFAELEHGTEGTKEGSVYLRYDCSAKELYAHVKAAEGVQLHSADPKDHFVRMGSDGAALVDGADEKGDFAFLDEDSDGVDDGWEARAIVATGAYPELQIVTKVRKDAEPSKEYEAKPKGSHVPLDVSCKPKGDEVSQPPTESKPPVKPAPTPPVAPAGALVAPAAPTPTSTRKARRPTTRLVSKKRGPSRARSGRKVKYTLRVTNTGKAAATNVVIRDVLPRGMVLVRRPRGAKITGRTITWRITRIAPRRTVKRTVRVRLLRNGQGRRCNRMVTRAGNAQVSRARKCTRFTRVNNARAVLPAVTG
jgi:uncharacterized repeat protein (TIGR01451 family)